MESSSHGNNKTSVTSKPNRKITDFNLVRIIGVGTFGKVYLSTYKGKSFALKMLHKRKIIELKQTDHILNEKNILANAQHPFIVNLEESFQDDKNLYLVFEFVQGGEVF